MIIDNFHVKGITLSPLKADPIPFIDSDAVLTFPISLECLKPVPWRHSQIFKPTGSIQVHQLTSSYALYSSKPRHINIVEKRIGVLAPKATDHGTSLLRCA